MLLSMFACAVHTVPHEPAVPTAAERLALDRSLVAEVQTLNRFAPQTDRNLGHPWSDDLPLLEAEFSAAATRPELLRALGHLGNSLHNDHSGFRPAGPNAWAEIDARLGVHWNDGRPTWFVVRAGPDAGGAQAGDRLVEADGVPAERLVERHGFESSGNSWRGIASDVAYWLTVRDTRMPVPETTSWVLERDGERVNASLRWRSSGYVQRTIEESFAENTCGALREIDYGPYRLVTPGVGYCLYAATEAPFDAFPIVRQHTYLYSAFGSGMVPALRADQASMRTALAALPRARGVILDLRENTGGNSPGWFMDWWAPVPYPALVHRRLLAPSLSDEQRLARVGVAGEDAVTYLAGLAAGQPWIESRFGCRPGACDEEGRIVPRHPVTTLPVAVLVGPHCVSACDSVSRYFMENDFAPLVGEPTSAAYAGGDLKLAVLAPDGSELGVLALAASYHVSGHGGDDIEGVPLTLDRPVDRTLENYARYDRLLVETAMEALAH